MRHTFLHAVHCTLHAVHQLLGLQRADLICLGPLQCNALFGAALLFKVTVTKPRLSQCVMNRAKFCHGSATEAEH